MRFLTKVWKRTETGEEACWSREKRRTEVRADPKTHRHIPRAGSSDPHPPAQQGPGLHSAGVQHPEDSAGTGSHVLAGLLGRCAGHSLVRRWAVAQSVNISTPYLWYYLPQPFWSQPYSSRAGNLGALGWLVATINLKQPRVTWEESLSEGLSVPGWTVGMSVVGCFNCLH